MRIQYAEGLRMNNKMSILHLEEITMKNQLPILRC
jgi:hypothetical protein